MRADSAAEDNCTLGAALRASEEAFRYRRCADAPPADHSGRTDGAWHRLIRKLDAFFEVSARGSTCMTELRAGLIAWMTMSYILVVNPVILSAADPHSEISLEALTTSTAFAAAIGSLCAGLLGKSPLGLMPGMGLNAYFTYGVCHAFKVSFQEALSCCFMSGLWLLLLALCGISQWIVKKTLSDHLKKAITVAIGLFQALIGFQEVGLIVHSPDTLVTLGDLSWSNGQLYVALVGFSVIAAMLISERVHGALLIGIWMISAFSWIANLSPAPSSVLGSPRFDAFLNIDFSGWRLGSDRLPNLMIGSLVMLFVALFDIAGVQFGLYSIAGLLKDGTVPRGRQIFASCALGTLGGAALGTSPVIIANESSAGIMEGARTGLSAVFVAVLFVLSAFVAPLLAAIPSSATAAPLVLIGAFMMEPCRGINWGNLRVAIPSFLTVTLVPFTYSIHDGIIAGILMDGFLGGVHRLAKGEEWKEVACTPACTPVATSTARRPTPAHAQNNHNRVLSSPHAVVAAAGGGLGLDEKSERVRQLLRDLTPPSATPAMKTTWDEALQNALRAYLDAVADNAPHSRTAANKAMEVQTEAAAQAAVAKGGCLTPIAKGG